MATLLYEVRLRGGRRRAQQDAIGFLQLNSKGQGPSAKLAWNHTEHVTGLDAEVRLQEDALRFEHSGQEGYPGY